MEGLLHEIAWPYIYNKDSFHHTTLQIQGSEFGKMNVKDFFFTSWIINNSRSFKAVIFIIDVSLRE